MTWKRFNLDDKAEYISEYIADVIYDQKKERWVGPYYYLGTSEKRCVIYVSVEGYFSRGQEIKTSPKAIKRILAKIKAEQLLEK